MTEAERRRPEQRREAGRGTEEEWGGLMRRHGSQRLEEEGGAQR